MLFKNPFFFCIFLGAIVTAIEVLQTTTNTSNGYVDLELLKKPGLRYLNESNPLAYKYTFWQDMTSGPCTASVTHLRIYPSGTLTFESSATTTGIDGDIWHMRFDLLDAALKPIYPTLWYAGPNMFYGNVYTYTVEGTFEGSLYDSAVSVQPWVSCH